MAGYWSGNWQNFKNALTPGNTQDVSVPDTTLGQAIQELSSPPAAVAPSVYGAGFKAEAPAQQGLQGPPPITLQPAGLKQAVTASQPGGGNPVVQPIPVGRYGWKGTSEGTNGQPTLVFGTPGQDGAGIVSGVPSSLPTPGSTLLNAGNSRDPRAVPVNTGQLAAAGGQRGLVKGGGFEFSGTAADAAKFFSGPRVNAAPGTSARFAPDGPRPKTPLEISIEALDKMRYGVDQGPQQPKYLTREEGAAMGLGWKGRLNKYNQDIEVFKNTTGQAAARDLEQMRQAGAGFQTLAQAQTENDKLQAGLGLRTAQTAEATAKANAENQLTAAATAFGQAKEGSDEQKTAMRNYMLLSKQMGGLGKAQEPIIKTVKEEVVDPVTKQIVTRERLVQVDPTKSTFTGLQDAGQQAAAAAVLPPVGERVVGKEYNVNGHTVKWNGKEWDKSK